MSSDEDEATLMSPNQFIIRSNGGENQFGCKTFENFNPTRFNLVKAKGEAEFGMKPKSLEKMFSWRKNCQNDILETNLFVKYMKYMILECKINDEVDHAR